MMSSASFGISEPNAPTTSEKIVASTLNAIQSLLPQSKIEQVCTEAHSPGEIARDWGSTLDT